jgi:hypothetical protein
MPHYDFVLETEQDHVYAFVTAQNVFYEVRFRPSSDYMPATFVWRDSLFEIIIDVVWAADLNRIPADRAVLATIIAIIVDFFRVNERVVLYICDDSDARQLARKRKFDNWYARFGSIEYAKMDMLTPTDGPEQFYASFFYRLDNPYRHEIAGAFEQLLMGIK